MYIGDKMYNENVFKVQLEIIINNSLYKKNLIDEDTYIKANEKLLNILKVL